MFLNLNLTGQSYTDYLLTDVGASAFQLEHDWITQEDCVIRTAASGGGTLLIQGADYIFVTKNSGLSTRVSNATGSIKSVYKKIQVTNASFQTGDLYFSGLYIGDTVEAEDIPRNRVKAVSGSYTIRRDDDIATLLVDATAGTATITLPALDGTNRRIVIRKVDSSANTVVITADGSDMIDFQVPETTKTLVSTNDSLEIEDVTTYWSINRTTLSASAISGWTTFPMSITGTVSNPTKPSSVVNDTAAWRRVGTDMEITYHFATTSNAGAAAGSGAYLFNLPTGYTIDFTKLTGTASSYYYWVGMANFAGSSLAMPGGLVGGDVAVVNPNISSSAILLAAVNTTGDLTLSLVGSGKGNLNLQPLQYDFWCRVPITQWTNNVNLATDFTEYVSNSSATDADDTTSFIYGSQGAVGILGVTNISAYRKKRVQFQRPIEATDLLTIEFYNPIAGMWSKTFTTATSYQVLQEGWVINTFGGGIGLIQVSSTQVDVLFRQYPTGEPSVTFANAAFANVRWRVRKTSKGNFAEQTPVLNMLPRTTTSTQLYSGSMPAVGNWGSAVQAIGNAGIPVGTKAIVATVTIGMSDPNGGTSGCHIAFSDNTTYTPSSTTSHPKVRFDGTFLSNGTTWSGDYSFQITIPLNASGQFYFYTLSSSNAHNFTVVANSYILNGIQT